MARARIPASRRLKSRAPLAVVVAVPPQTFDRSWLHAQSHLFDRALAGRPLSWPFGRRLRIDIGRRHQCALSDRRALFI